MRRGDAEPARARRSEHGRRGPRLLTDAFGAIADEHAPRTLLADVQRAWATAVGEMIAAQATPRAERGGVVTIACAASVWAQELDLMGPQIVARLGAAVGEGRVRRLRCVALGPSR